MNAGPIPSLPVATARLEPAPIAAEDIVAGSPDASWRILWRSHDGRLFNGIWACTPGTFFLSHPDETVCLTEGRATVTPDGGEPVELSPGDTAFFPAGMRAKWDVHETVRKAFHVHDAAGDLLAARPD